MNVRNKACVRRLSLRTLKAAGRRNAIAAVAIMLTTLLFTSLFTIVLSINSSYETYTFRQIGGYSHGTFKDVNDAQIQKLSRNSRIKEAGERIVVGTMTDGSFAKVPAELSFMDDNCAKWSYIEFASGRAPASEQEIAMDTEALRLLGVKPRIGAKITLTYDGTDKTQNLGTRTDTFRLCGWWEYDDLTPVHFINVSRAYADRVEQAMRKKGAEPLRRDLNIMLGSSVKIEETMERVVSEEGFQCQKPDERNYVGIGVNWGYTASQADAGGSAGTLAAIGAFLLLVIFTGYLIIYNIFRISVTGDIRYYGLLKTIGVTPRQIRKMIRQQALALCAAGCPAGLLLGYLAGGVLTPVILSQTTLGEASASLSASPAIFIGAAVFSVVTVLLSCAKPGRMAARVSPVEAAKYTEITKVSRQRRATRGAKIHQMAFANLGRSKGKTVLMVLSMSLAVVLLSILMAFTGGFRVEKYVSENTCADFIVGNTDYFRFEAETDKSGLNRQTVDAIKAGTDASLAGEAWKVDGAAPQEWIAEERFRSAVADGLSPENLETVIAGKEKRGGRIGTDLNLQGLDSPLMEKLTVLEGSLEPLKDPDRRAVAIAVDTDDYGNPDKLADYPQVGETLPVTYVEDAYYIDSRTGKRSQETTPEQNRKYHIEKGRDVEYTVCALVTIPYQMSLRSRLLYGDTAILNADRMRADCGGKIFSLFYMFDTPDAAAESEAESFLAEMTKGDQSQIMYESKASVREEFEGFRDMFLLLGGVLCGIIGLVGVLNFFNGIMTGILSRKIEFAMLQSIGMTGKQLKKMLICEGVFYAVSAILVSLALTALIGPLVGTMMENLFWFYEHHFTLSAIWMTAPVFVLLGAILPVAVYKSVSKKTIVERLRETE